ncbi:aminotransferase class III-fold pyridoxal phosphate-dependent enzyme [Denitratimonas sp. CY0512]|uniref:aminotransferase class III-fold pyridoxal phosphate-dependent enzyme n=1 Tax=Denitratimonas sp. CY0512 TaxID=3131940 RepID=UPI00309AD077
MNLIDTLSELRKQPGTVRTHGLSDQTLLELAPHHPDLVEAVNAARAQLDEVRREFPEIVGMDEDAQCALLQADFVNFYPGDAVNPYVALSARGPWIVTLKGAVLHDAGGYGMLGFGHTPAAVLEAMAKPQAMANVMTPSVSQLRLARALRAEIGQRRSDGCPYTRFLCLNSGSESVTLACRIVDIHAKLQTEPGARHAGKTIKHLAVKGAFHGRTEGPARYSDSSRKAYMKHLASYRDDDSLLIVDPYDIEQLRGIFAQAEREGWFIEAMFLEPVMGEGDPGRGVTPEFYAAARELTTAHGSLFLVDSIQAGLRAHGVLSVVDYPGFEQLPPPDMETYSKALNAGQYPLSVLAVRQPVAELYRVGIYGNTMTTNPRAMDVASTVLAQLTPQIRDNIAARGREFVEKLEALQRELPALITKVQGTGLLFSCELAPVFKCFGDNSIEEFMRERGIGVIHGGENSLRFTPHFRISSQEVDLIVAQVRDALLNGPRREAPAAA